MADIVLATINAKWIHPNVALRLLKANLGELEGQCTILEFALRQPLSEKISAIVQAGPKILAFSVSIWNHLPTLELILALKQAWQASVPASQGPIIVLGGPEVSWLAQDAEILSHANYLIRGEGEQAFAHLARALLQNQSPVFAPEIAQIRGKFIDARPVALEKTKSAYHLYTDEDLHRKLTYVEASRGCPFKCAFCLSSRDPLVRFFDIDVFLDDMDKLIARGARSFKFLDRTFNLDIARARRILEFFLARLRPGMFVHFEMVPARFPQELRSLLTQFPEGSLRLEIGIQTFNAETARQIDRISDPEKELETLRFLREQTKAIVHADLIAGLPGEDAASFAAGFNRLWAERPGEIQLGLLKRLPGTALAEREDGAVYMAEPPYEVLETPVLSRTELDRIKNFARFWELIVNRGHFEEVLPHILPEPTRAWEDFMRLSQWLLEKFGQNWGIPRDNLRSALTSFTNLSPKKKIT